MLLRKTAGIAPKSDRIRYHHKLYRHKFLKLFKQIEFEKTKNNEHGTEYKYKLLPLKNT